MFLNLTGYCWYGCDGKQCPRCLLFLDFVMCTVLAAGPVGSKKGSKICEERYWFFELFPAWKAARDQVDENRMVQSRIIACLRS